MLIGDKKEMKNTLSNKSDRKEVYLL